MSSAICRGGKLVPLSMRGDSALARWKDAQQTSFTVLTQFCRVGSPCNIGCKRTFIMLYPKGTL